LAANIYMIGIFNPIVSFRILFLIKTVENSVTTSAHLVWRYFGSYSGYISVYILLEYNWFLLFWLVCKLIF